jgi:hypothetical protein
MTARGKWTGMLAIARFNWPFYIVAIVVLFASIFTFQLGGGWAFCSGLGIFGCLYFLLGSLGVSHWIYDRSDLYQWRWLDRVLGNETTGRFVLCHSGFDEASGMLKQKFPDVAWTILDHYDPATMTEASIRRARILFPPTAGTVAAPFDHWPLAEASQQCVFGLLAIHELRSEIERAAWFAEARRCLTPDGKVIIVEHVRDIANFAAFGPGFVHFHSIAAWRRSWETSHLRLDDHFCITPFVRVFVLKRS